MSFLDDLKLSKGARAALPYIESIVSSDLTARAILTAARAAGFPLENVSGFKLISFLRDNYQSSSYWKSVNYNKNIDPYRIPQSITEIQNNYSYTVQLIGKSIDTGEAMTTSVQVGFNEIVTKDDAVNAALDLLQSRQDLGLFGKEERYGMTVDDANVTNILRKPGIL